MNKLSWFLYWAEVGPALAGSIGFLFGLLGFVAFIALGSNLVTRALRNYDEDANNWYNNTRWTWWVFPMCIVLFNLTNFVPSKQTLYLMAGSEMGQQVANTPEFNKVRALVNEYLDKELSKKQDDNEKKDDK